MADHDNPEHYTAELVNFPDDGRVVVNVYDGGTVNIHHERGVDDDDGTVDHNITGDIDLNDGTWQRVRTFDLGLHLAEFRSVVLGSDLHVCVRTPAALSRDIVAVYRKRS